MKDYIFIDLYNSSIYSIQLIKIFLYENIIRAVGRRLPFPFLHLDSCSSADLVVDFGLLSPALYNNVPIFRDECFSRLPAEHVSGYQKEDGDLDLDHSCSLFILPVPIPKFHGSSCCLLPFTLQKFYCQTLLSALPFPIKYFSINIFLSIMNILSNEHIFIENLKNDTMPRGIPLSCPCRCSPGSPPSSSSGSRNLFLLYNGM